MATDNEAIKGNGGKQGQCEQKEMGKNRDNVNKRKWGKQGPCEQKEMGKIGAM